MSAPKSNEYMVLFRSTDWEKNLSPEQLQNVMSQTMAWFEQLHAQGKMKAAQPLYDEGKVITGKKGQHVSDGPFAESKETVGGYLMLKVDSMEEAVAIAQGWPLLDCGCTVEVRPVAPECPSFKRINKDMVLAAYATP